MRFEHSVYSIYGVVVIEQFTGLMALGEGSNDGGEGRREEGGGW